MGCQKIPSHAVSRFEAREVLLGADQHSQKSIVVVIAYFLINSVFELQSTVSHNSHDYNLQNTTKVKAIQYRSKQ